MSINGPLVSIIIPCFNRETLVSETLDSIISQSYENWECILVDDRSTDDTYKILKEYEKKDTRFKAILRNENQNKGANSCRNIGVSKSKGNFIVFFDSDDLMTIDHLKIKLETILSNNYDFAITRTKYFNNPENINPMNYRDLGKVEINAENFITKKINWITFDIIIRSITAKKIKFTEKNASAEEYNYFCKLLVLTNNGIAVENVVSLRRFHVSSIQGSLIQNQNEISTNQWHYYWDTYNEIYKQINKNSSLFLINNCLEILFQNKHIKYNKLLFFKALVREKGILKAFNNSFKIKK